MHIDASSFSTYSYLRRRFGEVNAKILVNLTIVTDRNGLLFENRGEKINRLRKFRDNKRLLIFVRRRYTVYGTR